MYLDALGRFVVADKAILIEVGLLRNSVFVNHSIVEGISDTIHYGTLHPVGGRVGIRYHATIHRAKYP